MKKSSLISVDVFTSMLTLLSHCLSVRAADDTGVCTEGGDHFKPEFLDTDGRKSTGSYVKRQSEYDADACLQEKQTERNRLMFKRPEFIWGKEFNNSNTKALCETCIFTRGSSVQHILYTKRGTNLCTNVCSKQERRILRVAPTTVVLMDSYCTKRKLFAATCVCIIKISCHEYNHYAFVHFIVNRSGNVAMLYFEAGHPLTGNLERLL